MDDKPGRQPSDPFYKSYPSQRTNPKIVKLTDSEFRAWHYALCSARMMRPTGQWPSREYLEADLGTYAEHIPRLIELDLIREDEDGTMMSANWDANQRGITDPTNAERQQRWRDRQKAKRQAEREAATRRAAWTPVPCYRCGAPITDPEMAYHGDDEGTRHMDQCP